jgi:hypothetical protein
LLGELGTGCKVREVDLDAHDLFHVGVEFAQGFADAIEGDAHFLLEADGLVADAKRWQSGFGALGDWLPTIEGADPQFASGADMAGKLGQCRLLILLEIPQAMDKAR